MISHFTPILPGELFYSALARTLRLHPERSSPRQQCDWLLASSCRSFGVLLPAHGKRLLSQIPPAALVSEQIMMAASLYPAVAPFLEADDRKRLWQECINSEKPQLHGWFVRRAKKVPVFRYCPSCAQQDAAAGRQQHWRTVHQHPNVYACPYHCTELVQVAGARLAAPGALYPGDWIDIKLKAAPATNPLECFVARALLWLLEENTALPGGIRLRRAMIGALRAAPKYSSARRSGWNARLLEDIAREADAQCRQRNELNLRSIQQWTASISSRASQERNFSRFAFGCYALGISFKELFTAAMALPEPVREGAQHPPPTGSNH